MTSSLNNFTAKYKKKFIENTRTVTRQDTINFEDCITIRLSVTTHCVSELCEVW